MTSRRDPDANINVVARETPPQRPTFGRDPDPPKTSPVATILMIVFFCAIGYGAWRLYKFLFPF
jgi:hypothetical protein